MADVAAPQAPTWDNRTLAIGAAIVAGLVLLITIAVLCVRRSRGAREVDIEFGERSTVAELAKLSSHHRAGAKRAEANDGTGSADSFYSCYGEDIEDGRRWRSSRCSFQIEGPDEIRKPKRPRQNSNVVTQYAWLEPLMESIVAGEAALAGAVDLDTGQPCTPLFVVAGVCPSSFPPSPMQAVVFCQLANRAIDFWWCKPEAKEPDKLDTETLSRHKHGRYKNVAERSRKLYEPLAHKFAGGKSGDFTYGVDECGRAFVEEGSGLFRRRMLVYFIWIENWSSGMSGKKFLEGKLCYEKIDISPETTRTSGRLQYPPGVPRYFARQYRIEDGQILLAPFEEEEDIPSMMPPECFQEMY